MKEEQERTPLRAILQNFLNHIEKLDSEEVEGSYEKEFQELKLFSEILKSSKQFSCSHGEKEVNRKKNRYKDILPFDESRVILDGYAGVPGSDYINANFIKGASGSPAYIASQAPLPHTVNDFWRMVVQCEVQVIVMACNEEEAGKHKCENYWVEREGEERQFGMVAIRLIKASVVCPDFLVRTMRLKYTNSQSSVEERTVCQFHYSAWPDHGVPPLVRPLLDMVRLVRDTQASETLPVLVHCSAGCGRTGTICAIDYVWGLLRAGKLTKDFSLFKLVRDMRRQRIAMVQTKEQYILVHHAVKELFCEQLRMIDSHPYENIDVNGMPLVKESSEPMYATVAHENGSEEKQDSKEKEDTPNEKTNLSPLPSRKKPHTASSKHEKEVENLTEKQRSIVEQSSNSDNVASLLQKPRIAKLKALFERAPANRENRNMNSKHRTPQQVTRSHSLGAVRKAEHVSQPIPCKGILRVPQLTTVEGPPVRCIRPAVPIKRSKSLKVLGSGECYKLSVASYDDTSSCKDTCSLNTSNASYGENRSSKKLDPVKLGKDNTDVFVKDKPQNDSKPCIPPKKLTKDRIRDKKVVSNICEVQVPTTSHVDTGAFPRRMCEASQQSSITISTVQNQRRRSLESFTLDDMSLSIQQGNVNCSQVVSSNSPGKGLTGRLDKDVPKMHQNSIVCLLNSCKSSISPGEKKVTRTQCVVETTELQPNLSVETQKQINAIVAGLGIRERRNSFRQAINTSKDRTVAHGRSNGREYEAVWISGSTPSRIGDNLTVFSKSVGAPGQNTSSDKCQFKGSAVSNNSLCYNSFSTQQPLQRGSQKPPQHVRHGIELVRAKSDIQFVKSSSNGSATVRLKGNLSKETEFDLMKQNSAGKHVQPKFSQETRNSILTVKSEKMVAIPKSTNAWPTVQSNVRIDAAGITCGPLREKSEAVRAGITCGPLREKSEAVRDHNEEQRKFMVTSTKSKTCVEIPVEGMAIPSGVAPVHKSTKAHRESDDRVAGLRKADLSERTRMISSDMTLDHKIPSRCMNATLGDKASKDLVSIPQHLKTLSSSSRCSQICTSSFDKKIGPASTQKPTSSSTQKPTSLVSQLKTATGRVAEEPKKRLVQHERGMAPMLQKKDDGTSIASAAAKVHNSSETDVVSYGLVAGVQLRRGSRDDLALCGGGPTVPPRVRRHASVVLLRHSLIETSDGTPMAPLTVWNGPEQGEHINKGPSNPQSSSWGEASGIDLDSIAANIKSQPGEHNAAVLRTLEALHLRKSSPRSGQLISPAQSSFHHQQSSSVKKQHYL